jgi:mRNA interferase RelE/StbE
VGSYKIEFKRSAEKELRKLDKPLIPNIIRRIEQLATNPRPRQSKKLTGSERGYRLRAREYRIIYQVDEEAKEVTIYSIKHRKEVY